MAPGIYGPVGAAPQAKYCPVDWIWQVILYLGGSRALRLVEYISFSFFGLIIKEKVRKKIYYSCFGFTSSSLFVPSHSRNYSSVSIKCGLETHCVFTCDGACRAHFATLVTHFSSLVERLLVSAHYQSIHLYPEHG